MAFSETYQRIYDAAIARQRENEAKKRAMLTNAAANAGVQTSGVAQIGQGAISQEALRSEGDIGANVAQQQEQERLQQEQFAQQEKLYGMQLAEAARERRRQRREDVRLHLEECHRVAVLRKLVRLMADGQPRPKDLYLAELAAQDDLSEAGAP